MTWIESIGPLNFIDRDERKKQICGNTNKKSPQPIRSSKRGRTPVRAVSEIFISVRQVSRQMARCATLVLPGHKTWQKEGDLGKYDQDGGANY